MVVDMFVCSRCGRREATDAPCPACKTDSMWDLRSRHARSMLDDAESRFRSDRDGKLTRLAAAIGVAVGIVLWFVVPGYWSLFTFLERSRRLLILSQVGILFGVAYGARALLDLRWPKQRFDFLDRLPAPDRD